MSVAALIKRARLAKGWSQKQLADTIGVTPGFVTKLEAGDAFPSYERGLALANALGLAWDDLWSRVEVERDKASEHRRRTRGAALQGAVQTRGVPGAPPALPPAPAMTAEAIAQEIGADTTLLTAYHHLKRALADPQLRPTVLAALEAFARAAHPRP